MPGIDMNLSEQQNYYEVLLKQYKRETELFNSYKEMCKFDVSQLESPPKSSESETNMVDSNALQNSSTS